MRSILYGLASMRSGHGRVLGALRRGVLVESESPS